MGGFGSDSGTSMASPYIAGCAALFLEGKPKSEHNSVAFKTALQNFALPIVDGNPHRFKGPASVLQQGAGQVQMMDVLNSIISISPSHVALNDTVHLNSRQTFTITNRGKTPVTYRVDLVTAVGLTPFETNGTVAVLPKKTFATASIKSVQTIRVDPGSNATVDLDFSGPKNNPLLHVLYSGFIRFRPEKADKSTPMISVPFMGMKGDYKTVGVFDPSFGLRYFDRKNWRRIGQDGDSLSLNITGLKDTKDDQGDDTPPSKTIKAIVQFRLLTACRLLVLDLVSDKGSDPAKVKSYGLLNRGVGRYLPRSDTQEGNEAQLLGWDGKVLNKDGTPVAAPLAKGSKARIRISLLKHFGDPEKDSDYESFLSKPFSLS